MFANAAITLSVLRGHLRSSIPVEIVHYGPKELPAQEILQYISMFNGTGDAAVDAAASNSTATGVLGPVFITDALAAAPPETAAATHRKLPEGFKSFPAKVYALTYVTRFKQVRDSCLGSVPRDSGRPWPQRRTAKQGTAEHSATHPSKQQGYTSACQTSKRHEQGTRVQVTAQPAAAWAFDVKVTSHHTPLPVTTHQKYCAVL